MRTTALEHPARHRGTSIVVPPPDAPAETLDGPALVAMHLPVILDAIRLVCAQHHVAGDAALELKSVVLLRLLEDDGDVLRRFRAESSLLTFLVVVVRRLLFDTWTAERGKWRPSAEARQLGAVAILLERLVYHDETPWQEATETVRFKLGVPDSDGELAFLHSLLPKRTVRRFVGEDGLARLRSTEPDPLESLLRQSACSRESALGRALAVLGAEERLLIALRFEERLTVRAIAQRRNLDQKMLYRRYQRIFRRLRTLVERELGQAGESRA